MFISTLLALIIGICMVVVGISLLTSPKTYKKIAVDYKDQHLAPYLAALFALIIGLLLVLTHNKWQLNWPVIITIIGWLSLIKGAAYLIFPEYFKRFAIWYIDRINIRAFGILYLLLGIFLSAKGLKL